MHQSISRLLFGVCVLLASSQAVCDEAPVGAAITFDLLSDDFQGPVQITSIPGDADHLLVVESSGLVERFSKKERSSQEVIDIEDLISNKQPRGLLSIALTPSRSEEAFINYIDTQGDLVVGRFQNISKQPVDESSMSVVIKIAHISRNEQGSQIAFSPENALLISTGDGQAGANSAIHSAQSKTTLLGKVLRIDPLNPTRYTVPSSNPFGNQPPTLPEIWALGFRDPDQLWIDQTTGRVFVIDNSESMHELNVVESGQNYGWDTFEGARCRAASCPTQGFTAPVLSWPRQSPDSRLVAGGIYRGKRFAHLAGAFIVAESKTGVIFAAQESPQRVWQYREVARLPQHQIAALGYDLEGELYVATIDGSLFQLIPEVKK